MATESVKCNSNLSQRANEPGKDFFFRVGNSTYLSCQKALEAVKADDTLTTAENGFNACLNSFSRVLFINGFQAGVKPIIKVKFSQLQDMKSFLAAVVEAKIAAADRRDSVHALELELSALQNQAKYWWSGTSSGKGAGPKRAGSQSHMPSTTRAPLGYTHGQKVAARTKWINCFRCQQWGKHQANVSLS